MTNRVVLGERNGQFGLWISKPGLDVLGPLTESQFLFNSNFRIGQIAQTGRINLTDPFSPVEISIIDLGFRPVVRCWVSGYSYVALTYVSNSRIRFEHSPEAAGITTNAPYRVTDQNGNYAQPYIVYQIWALQSL